MDCSAIKGLTRVTLNVEIPPGYLDQYSCTGLRLQNNQDHRTVKVYKYMQRMETVKQSGLWSSLGTHVSLVVMYWLCISCSNEIRNFDLDLEGQVQSPWQTIGTLSKMFCSSGSNLVILAWMSEKKWHGQKGVNFEFGVKSKLEGHNQLPPKQQQTKLSCLHLWSKFGDPNLN